MFAVIAASLWFSDSRERGRIQLLLRVFAEQFLANAFGGFTAVFDLYRAGGVVLKDGDLVGAEIDWHVVSCARVPWYGKTEILTGTT
jgi:hypothetical protein